MSADRAIALLEDLVAFDTTSRNPNRPLIDYVADYLRGFGIEPRIIPDDSGAKANLFATIGPEVAGGIVLSGHSDVVPVDGQDWSTDPFAVSEREGRLYGRGTADMKGFIACALAMVPDFLARGSARPIHLAFSYDEEVGCLGVGRMIDAIRAGIPAPAAVVVGEPTSMRIATAHKGVCVSTTTVTGHAAHSSRMADGVSAVRYAAELVSYLYRLCDELAASERDARFDPPFTTFNAGRIGGGEAINIIARECVLNWEFRPIPGADADAIAARVEAFVEEELLPRMRRVAPEASVETVRDVYVPPFDAPPGTPAEAAARAASGQNRTEALAFVTEASLFAGAGLPAVVCGPGDIAQAHQPDEFVAVSQLEECLAFLARLDPGDIP